MVTTGVMEVSLQREVICDYIHLIEESDGKFIRGERPRYDDFRKLHRDYSKNSHSKNEKENKYSCSDESIACFTEKANIGANKSGTDIILAGSGALAKFSLSVFTGLLMGYTSALASFIYKNGDMGGFIKIGVVVGGYVGFYWAAEGYNSYVSSDPFGEDCLDLIYPIEFVGALPEEYYNLDSVS